MKWWFVLGIAVSSGAPHPAPTDDGDQVNLQRDWDVMVGNAGPGREAEVVAAALRETRTTMSALKEKLADLGVADVLDVIGVPPTVIDALMDDEEAADAAAGARADAADFVIPAQTLSVDHLNGRPLGLTNPAPRFSWEVRARTPTAARGRSATHYRIVVTTASSTDDQQKKETVWNSGAVAASSTTLVPYAGKALQSDTDYTWTVSTTLDDKSVITSDTAAFRTGLLTTAEWNATWITGGNVNTLLRTDFTVPDTPTRATLFVSGIGYNEVHINGKRVGDRYLDPGWTDYAKRVYYTTYDVADLLVPGKDNAIGVSLGNGWFACNSPTTTQPGCVNSPPQLLLQLQVDGVAVVVSDPARWTAAAGPITYNSLYNGEHYDSRMDAALAGFSSPGFRPGAGWAAAAAASSDANSAALVSAAFQPIRRLQTFAPLKVTSPARGVFVYDFGQNMAGVVRLQGLVCKEGANVTVRHAEVLMHPPYGPVDGSIYVGNLRAAQATDVYICKGDVGGEDYSPTFTQHGFRYAEVSGLAYPLTGGGIVAVEMHTDVAQHSSVWFGGDPLLNQIQNAVVWGQKTNYMSLPTDCPQRDERRGWMGDAALTIEEAMYNFDVAALMTHWLRQIHDDQMPDGSVANYVPSLGEHSPGAPNWESAFPSILWSLWMYRGDIAPAVEHHDALVAYFDFFESQYNHTGLKNFMTGFGDWVPPPESAKAQGHLVGSYAYLHDLQLGAELFQASPHPAAPTQASRLARQLARLGGEFHAAFYDASKGFYGSGLQTEQAMPLSLGIVPDSVRAGVLNYTAHDVMVTHDSHTTTGIIGIKCLLESLAELGRMDVALSLVLTDTYPSYGFMIRGKANPEPATTVWELWDSHQHDPGMNSRNHIMYGTVGAWFYRRVLGVTPALPGYDAITVRPMGVGVNANLTSASGQVATPHGPVGVSWAVRAAGADSAVAVDMSVSVPVGANATVWLPLVATQDMADVTVQEGEGQHVVWKGGAFVRGVAGVLSGTTSGDGAAVQLVVTSGDYAFTLQ